MKNKIIYLIAFVAVITASCKKSFLTDIPPYGNLDESAFANETQTGWYIDRMYNYYFGAFKSPTQQESSSAGTGTYDDSKTKNTEEIGGTISSYINPNTTLINATNADTYYGTTLPSSGITNTAYTRIRLANFLLQEIDGVGKALPASFRATAKGQAYYFRALEYYYLVRVYGGVPIVLTVSEASSTDTTIRTPRSTATQCFAQIMKDFDSAASLLPAVWPATDYGRFTSAAAYAMKSRVSLMAASPLFNSDWDNPASTKWQTALQAGLAAETYLTNNGYGLYGSSAKDWAAMTTATHNTFNKEAIYVQLFSSQNPATVTLAYNNSWENNIRPKDMNGTGGVSVPKAMLDLFPMADGTRPTAANGYVDTFFFANRDPRFYRTFAFSGSKWGIKGNASRTTFFYRWRSSATGTPYYYGANGGNQTSSPAEVCKFTDPTADSSIFTVSGTDIFDYRYAELLLNIAECYAATGDIANCTNYLGKIRARVGINSANNYGIGVLANKYAAIEACLYERRVELAYEGKRYWDIQRWLLYDGTSSTYTGPNTCDKLGLPHINGTNRTGYYWQLINYTSSKTDPLTAADKNILVDPDAADFATQIANLKAFYKAKCVMTPLDKPMDVPSGSSAGTNILFRPNYYLSGLTATILGSNPWLLQNIGWLDYSGAPGTFDPTK
jgi:hypothetical protein